MTPYVITLHRERILSQSKKAFSSNGDKKTRIRGKAGISFLPAKVAPCPEKPGKAALRAGCREIIILAALAVFFHGKPCGIPDRGGKAFRK